MRICLFKIVHFGLVASRVRYLNILQGSICVLFILQAHVVGTALLQFGIVELRASWNFTLKPKLLRLVIQNSRLLLKSAGLLNSPFCPTPNSVTFEHLAVGNSLVYISPRNLPGRRGTRSNKHSVIKSH